MNKKYLLFTILICYALIFGAYIKYISYKINKIYTIMYYPNTILTIVGYNTTEYIIKPNSSNAILEKMILCCNINNISFINENHFLKHLDLSENKNIKNLDNLYLPYLEIFNMVNCNITDIYFLNKFYNLLELDISYNPYIKNIHELYIPSLTVLNLNNNNIIDIRFINKFNNLISLNLSYNFNIKNLIELSNPSIKYLSLDYYNKKILNTSSMRNLKNIFYTNKKKIKII